MRKPGRVPWYRAANYRGNLTEDQKALLDGFRKLERHPAASRSSLPDEVQRYINILEMEVYDAKQSRLAGQCIVAVVAGVWLLLDLYIDLVTPSVWTYVLIAFLIVGAPIVYRFQFRRNADAFVPTDNFDATDEAIRAEWEISYLARHAATRREGS